VLAQAYLRGWAASKSNGRGSAGDCRAHAVRVRLLGQAKRSGVTQVMNVGAQLMTRDIPWGSGAHGSATIEKVVPHVRCQLSEQAGGKSAWGVDDELYPGQDLRRCLCEQVACGRLSVWMLRP
jgi:hypothetical protein